jgi:hypothetical protein
MKALEILKQELHDELYYMALHSIAETQRAKNIKEAIAELEALQLTVPTLDTYITRLKKEVQFWMNNATASDSAELEELQAPKGCDGCKNEPYGNTQCLDCLRYYTDRYEPKGSHD